MRLRNITGSRDYIAESEFVIHDPQLCKGNWQQVFKNEQEIHIEIGMGKGRFIMDMARLHPEINYIGLEKYSAVLLRAIQKMEEAPIDNVRFIRMDAVMLEEVFAPGEVSRIYLNFSDPWPKDRHAKRRLPGREFLAKYSRILKSLGRVEFKTDNRPLFDFAVEETEPAGWRIVEITYDLHHNEQMMQGNVMTEYEEKFSREGNPICKLVIDREV